MSRRRARARILFVGSFPPPERHVFGGNVTACAGLMGSAFARELEVLTLDSSARTVPAPPLLARIGYGLARSVRFVASLERSRPDAVLLFCSAGASFAEKAAYAAYARLRGVPSILSMRDGGFMGQYRRSRLFRALARRLVGAPRMLLCQGATWQRYFAETFALPGERLPIVENWVASPGLLALAEDRGRRAAAAGEVSLLFVGHVERTKGVFELLDTVASLAASAPGVRLVIAGDGTARAEAERRAEELGIADRVRFAGWITGREKLDAFAAADVFVLPSHFEGFPNVVVEAMAAGLPVVTTPVGSVADVIEPGKNGLLVPVEDAKALAEAISRLASDPAERRRMGAEGHRTARARFATEAAAERLVALVREVCGGAPPAPLATRPGENPA
ncbi:MAG TPA: glycosyltransferase family 4 protein [Longimicrobium sp.]